MCDCFCMNVNCVKDVLIIIIKIMLVITVGEKSLMFSYCIMIFLKMKKTNWLNFFIKQVINKMQ